jgi:hypothetical protein
MRNIIIAAAIAFAAGFFTSVQFTKADRVDQVVQEKKEIVNAVVDSAERDNDVSEKLDNREDRAEAANVVIQKIPVLVRVPSNCEERISTTPDHQPQDFSASRLDSNLYLSIGAVSVLDAAREDREFDSAEVVNEESRAASDVTVEELIQNDLEVVNRYHDLSIRHDSLVDYVCTKIDNQLKASYDCK